MLQKVSDNEESLFSAPIFLEQNRVVLWSSSYYSGTKETQKAPRNAKKCLNVPKDAKERPRGNSNKQKTMTIEDVIIFMRRLRNYFNFSGVMAP